MHTFTQRSRTSSVSQITDGTGFSGETTRSQGLDQLAFVGRYVSEKTFKHVHFKLLPDSPQGADGIPCQSLQKSSALSVVVAVRTWNLLS